MFGTLPACRSDRMRFCHAMPEARAYLQCRHQFAGYFYILTFYYRLRRYHAGRIQPYSGV
ncbi:hypothetical protein KCP69_00750 [Salmonella enterica subsp. enterica]|nr:hypothetical protein KCP69_00750 [Salmonella enterica subsp. enterica]